jgi:hypothetical protein
VFFEPLGVRDPGPERLGSAVVDRAAADRSASAKLVPVCRYDVRLFPQDRVTTLDRANLGCAGNLVETSGRPVRVGRRI